MKNEIKSVVLLIVLVFCLTGCVKLDANINIHKYKSMDFEIVYAFDSSLLESKNIISLEKLKEMEANGFRVETYNENSKFFVKLIKNVENIDNISTTDDIDFNLLNILENNNDSYLFKVKKGLFKNIYKSQLSFTLSENDDYSDNVDLSITVSLPYKAISNNATFNIDNKNLTWKLNNQDFKYIDVEFALYNMTSIFLGIGIILVLFIFIVIALVIVNKNNKHDNINISPAILNNDIDLSDNIETDFVDNNFSTLDSQELQSIHLGDAPEVKTDLSIPVPSLNIKEENDKEISQIEDQFNIEDVFNLSSIPQDGLVKSNKK